MLVNDCNSDTPLRVRVAKVYAVTSSVRAFRLEALGGGILPSFLPGAHVGLWLPDSSRVRQYSIASSAMELDHYLIGVKREQNGRGGSRYLFEQVREGDVLIMSKPTNSFALVLQARRHVLLGGGIGVTPLLSMADSLSRAGMDFELHMLARTEGEAPFFADMQARYEGRFHPHFDQGDPRRSMDIEAFIQGISNGTHLYCCGPSGLIEAVRVHSQLLGENVHFEAFSARETNTEPNSNFTVSVADTGEMFGVEASESLLDALRSRGYEVDSACEVGTCGTCAIRVLSGESDHRDSALSVRDRENGWILSCVSRCRGERLVVRIENGGQYPSLRE